MATSDSGKLLTAEGLGPQGGLPSKDSEGTDPSAAPSPLITSHIEICEVAGGEIGSCGRMARGESVWYTTRQKEN